MKIINLTGKTANEGLRDERLGVKFWDAIDDPEQRYETAKRLGFSEIVSSVIYKGFYAELIEFYKTSKLDLIPKELLLDWYLERHYSHICFDTFKFRSVKLKPDGSVVELEEEDFDTIHTNFRTDFPWCSYPENLCYKKIVSFSRKNNIDTKIMQVKGLSYGDKKPRLNTLLNEMVSAMGVIPEEKEAAKIYLRTWYAGLIQRSLKPGSKFDLILVLHGQQGVGKTTFLENVFPGDTYVMSNSRDLDSKDKLINLSTHSVVIWDEIGSFSSKYMQEAIKQFLTLNNDTFRPVWGRQTVTRGRRCAFAATTNDPDILEDLSGNRRYMVFTVGEMDLPRIYSVQEKLMALIRELLLEGKVVPYLNREETKMQKINNLKYKKEDCQETIILEWAKNRDMFSTIDLAQECLNLPGQSVDRKLSTEINKILRSAGYEQKRVRQGKDVRSLWSKKHPKPRKPGRPKKDQQSTVSKGV